MKKAVEGEASSSLMGNFSRVSLVLQLRSILGTKDCSDKIRYLPHFKEVGVTIKRYTKSPRHTGQETEEWDFLKLHRVVNNTHWGRALRTMEENWGGDPARG